MYKLSTSQAVYELKSHNYLQKRSQKMIDVTAAIIIRKGNIFIAKRSSNSSLPNKWEFPGGKIDIGEAPEECLQRELYEEFDISVVVGDFVTESIYPYEEGTVRLIAFQVYTKADITTLNAHDEVRWVPIKELLDYDLAPADVPIAKKLQQHDWKLKDVVS